MRSAAMPRFSSKIPGFISYVILCEHFDTALPNVNKFNGFNGFQWTSMDFNGFQWINRDSSGQNRNVCCVDMSDRPYAIYL